jgi:hypothetical protein
VFLHGTALMRSGAIDEPSRADEASALLAPLLPKPFHQLIRLSLAYMY